MGHTEKIWENTFKHGILVGMSTRKRVLVHVVSDIRIILKCISNKLWRSRLDPSGPWNSPVAGKYEHFNTRLLGWGKG